jgi:hypothetical protein
MTANEMALDLELKLDRAFSFGSPGYEDLELSRVLTLAQLHYAKRFISSLTNFKKEGFEETEARGQGFSALINNSDSLTESADQAGTLPNGTFYDLPEDFMFTILDRVKVNVPNCTTNENFMYARASVVPHDEYIKLRRNYYRRPYADGIDAVVFRMFFSPQLDAQSTTPTPKRHELITDGTFNVIEYSIRYLKFPPDIVVDRQNEQNQRNCILDEFTHSPIVDIAADLMLEIVKEQKTPTQPTIDNFE